MLKSLLLMAAFVGCVGACSGATTISSSNLCPDPASYCEGNVLMRCRTDTSGLIPEPVITETDCGSASRFCVPEPDGASCR